MIWSFFDIRIKLPDFQIIFEYGFTSMFKFERIFEDLEISDIPLIIRINYPNIFAQA